MELEDGLTFTGELKNGKPNGNGTLTTSYGNNFTGNFIDGSLMFMFMVINMRENIDII